MKKPIVELNHLTTGYVLKKGHKVIAKEVTATLYSGELTCLLGPNGAGKSTLLRTLSGNLPPIAGSITLCGRPFSSYTSQEMSTLLGIVLTEKCSIRNMTVRELIGLGRSPYTGFWGILRETDYKAIDLALEQVGIPFLADRMVQTLSDGERQKMMIAKALAQETPIIFLDEPTAFLDFPSKVETMQLLRKLSYEMGKTIFLSTHDLELALQIADKLWLIDGAKQVRIGTPEDLSLDGSLSQFFSSEEILFDTRSGLFRIQTHGDKNIGIKGEDNDRKSMLRKALQRNGYAVIDNNETSLWIEVTNSAFVIHSATQNKQAATIEELLSFLSD